ncbi:MAG: Gfo/Idh/MocA family oxidoreductase [Armatimonadetes bacterium]|nr:Gfo/Idh/MocA family oxidoreductase [Armatimonadota bacterium]
MSQTVRIGFIGTGGIAQAHLGGLKAVPEAEIVALCDIDEARVKAVAEPYGASVYTDGAKLIENEKLDALYICVPPHVHGDMEIRAARKGLHLFVEKPVNLYMDKAIEANKAIQEAGVMSQAGYVLRYFPGFMRMHEFLKGKEIGTAHVFRWGGMPGVPWWRRYEQAGGQLVEMTTHQVDFLRWCMGEAESVAASYSFNRLFRDDPSVSVPDSQATLIRFESGASATVSTSCVIGSGGMGGLDFVLKNARASLQGENVVVDPEGTYEVPAPPAETPGIDASFVKAIATGDRSLLKSPFEDAMKSLAVTLAANRSAEEGGRMVKLEELLPDS